jgi:HAD superfamily hydrolase (TIGR01490 family)
MSLPGSDQETMRLALFDLDNTLLAGDSDHAWGNFLADIGAVDAEAYTRANDAFYAQYLDGTLDIREFCRFVFQPLARNPLSTLERWREEFLREQIRPMIAPGAADLLERHRRSGDTLLIITATNSFVTRPIAEMLGVSDLLATEPEFREGRFTGELTGTPCFQEGKILRLQDWLRAQGQPDEVMANACFYSDSRNDIPLLEAVGEPIAVDADPALAAHARERGWPHISLRSRVETDLPAAPDTV